MREGIILAPTRKAGGDAKAGLGLKYWYVITPDMLLDGRFNQVQCEPRILAVHDPGHNPMSTTILQYSNYLVNMCGGRTPDVWHLRRSGQ